MDLHGPIETYHDEFNKMLNESGSNILAGITIVSVNDHPHGQLVLAPENWADEKIISRLQACIDGIRERGMIGGKA